MKNILICNQKGGVGKTMIADELAFAFEKDNIPINFYNLDPQGGTLHKGHEREDAEISIVDTPGALTGDLKEWLKSADLVIVPTRPTGRDVDTLFRMRDIVKKAGLPVLYVVNGSNRWRASRQFAEWLSEELKGETILEVPQSETFVQAVLAEKSVVEMGDSPAAKAVKNLYETVKKMLGVANG